MFTTADLPAALRLDTARADGLCPCGHADCRPTSDVPADRPAYTG